MLSLKYKNIVKKALYENDYSEQVVRLNMSTIQSVYNILKNINVDNKIYEREDKGVKIFYTLQKNNDDNIKLSAIDRAKVIMTDKVKNYSNHKKSQLYILKGIGIEKINDTYHLSEIKDKLWLIVWDETENISDLYQIPEIKRFFNHGCHMFEEVETNLLKIYNDYKKILYPLEQNNDDDIGTNYNTEEAKSNPPEKLDNVNKVNDNDNDPVFTGKKWKATKEFMFDPQHIIGDNKFRSKTQLKNKIEGNLYAFLNDKSSTDTKAWVVKDKEGKEKVIVNLKEDDLPPQYVAATYLIGLVENVCDNKDPFIPVNIPEDFKSKPTLDYINGMKIPEKLTFDKRKAGYAKEVVKLLDDKPTEILSPLVVLSLNDKIFPNDNNKTKNTLTDVFGGEKGFKNGLVSYPAASEELVDSYCAIKNGDKYSLLGVSTKGGYDGRGAQASTISLFRMIYNDPNSIPGKLTSKFDIGIDHKTLNEDKLCNSVFEKLNTYGQKLFKKNINNKVTLTILTLFGGSLVKDHMTIFENLRDNNIFGLNNNINTLTEFCHFINDKYNITDCIMNILDSQKYKFAQLNCTPSLTDNDFGFNYKIQYPAHFEGTVSFEPRGKGIGFHILGKVA